MKCVGSQVLMFKLISVSCEKCEMHSPPCQNRAGKKLLSDTFCKSPVIFIFPLCLTSMCKEESRNCKICFDRSWCGRHTKYFWNILIYFYKFYLRSVLTFTYVYVFNVVHSFNAVCAILINVE